MVTVPAGEAVRTHPAAAVHAEDVLLTLPVLLVLLARPEEFADQKQLHPRQSRRRGRPPPLLDPLAEYDFGLLLLRRLHFFICSDDALVLELECTTNLSTNSNRHQLVKQQRLAIDRSNRFYEDNYPFATRSVQKQGMRQTKITTK